MPFVLTLNDVEVAENDFISASDIGSDLLVFTPAEDANGTGYASFDFKVQDDGTTVNGGADLDTTARTMTIDVTAVNDAPVTYDITLDTKPNVALTTIDLKSMAYDADGDELGITIVANATYGNVTANGGGIFTYTPNTDYTGPDTFTFKATDTDDVDSNTSTVTINVVNNAPVLAGDLYYTVAPNASLTLTNLIGNASDADGDALTVLIDYAPTGGGAMSYNGSGVDVYTAGSSPGDDYLIYHVVDGSGGYSSTVTVYITVSSATIIANPVVTQAYMNEELVIPQSDVLANASSQVTSPWISSFNDDPVAAHGTVTRDGNGDLHYLPEEGYTGPDSFSFTITDGVNFATSSVLINVQATECVVLNFLNLNGNTQAGTYMRIILSDINDVQRANERVNITTGATAGADAAAAFAVLLAADGYTVVYVPNSTQLTITRHAASGTDVRRIVIRESTVPVNRRIAVTESSRVNVHRGQTGG